METYSKAQVIAIIASSFDASEIIKEVRSMRKHWTNMTEIGKDTYLLLTAAILSQKP